MVVQKVAVTVVSKGGWMVAQKVLKLAAMTERRLVALKGMMRAGLTVSGSAELTGHHLAARMVVKTAVEWAHLMVEHSVATLVAWKVVEKAAKMGAQMASS